MEVMAYIAQAAGWFMVAAFGFALGGAVLTGLYVLVRMAWRS